MFILPPAKKATKAKQQKVTKIVNTTPLYVLLVVLFAVYFILQRYSGVAIVMGALIFFTIISLLILEVANGVREEGYRKNLIEIGIAIIVVFSIWFGLRIVLNTAYPIDVVPSCSMLPVLHRGDMILLEGVNKQNIQAPIVNVTSSQLNQSFANLNSEALECVAYRSNGGTASISQIVEPGYTVGLLKTNGQGISEIVSNNSQSNNLIKYDCGETNIVYTNGTVAQEAYTTAITIGNTTISGDKNNSIVVYQTIPSDLFYKEGDSYIVHRVYAVLNVSGSYYVLTKGDNNPGLDLQYFNYPASLSQVQGKVIGGVPFLGYVKLILSSNFVEPTGCNYTTEN